MAFGVANVFNFVSVGVVVNIARGSGVAHDWDICYTPQNADYSGFLLLKEEVKMGRITFDKDSDNIVSGSYSIAE